jgi:hypothetical protein
MTFFYNFSYIFQFIITKEAIDYLFSLTQTCFHGIELSIDDFQQ